MGIVHVSIQKTYPIGLIMMVIAMSPYHVNGFSFFFLRTDLSMIGFSSGAPRQSLQGKPEGSVCGGEDWAAAILPV
jgi:hypothetical protein